MEDLSPQEQHTIEQKVDEIYKAIIGDNLGNKGIVKRLEAIEAEVIIQKRFREKILVSFGVIVTIATFVGWVSNALISYFHHQK